MKAGQFQLEEIREDAMRRRYVIGFQRRVLNPIVCRLARYLPGEVVLETIGRHSGRPRKTPVGGRRHGNTFWLISEFGRQSNYVRNLEAEPRVRVEIGGRWYAGTAAVLDDDDVRARLRELPRVNSIMVRLVGTELVTIRIDLDAEQA